MKTIEETNRLIAIYMEWTIEPGMENETDPIYNFNNGWGTSFVSEMLFHKSWDWLMLVIEKIETLPFRFEIGKHSVYVYHTNSHDHVVYVDADLYETKIEATYQAVVKFIEYYNSNKHEIETSKKN